MTPDDYARKLDDLDRLLNDPDVPMQPGLIWHLLAEVSGSVVPDGAMPGSHADERGSRAAAPPARLSDFRGRQVRDGSVIRSAG